MAKYIFLFIWIVTFSVSAGERGYYLFVWGNPEGKEYFKEIELMKGYMRSINPVGMKERGTLYE